MTGSNNTTLGSLSDVGTANLTNATAIGYRARVAQSNSLVLGSINGVNDATADTNVGIGTTTPKSTLQVNGYVQLGLTSGTPPAADCDDASKYGRMKVDAMNAKLFVCTSAGWASTVLIP